VDSSVFEYLSDVPGVAAELARVLRPSGILLLSVPNPYNHVRRMERWLSQAARDPGLTACLERIPRVRSYATYLRLSRNRWDGERWQSALRAAQFSAININDFSEAAWRAQAGAPLVFLSVKKVKSCAR
jgi:SAM-dependent methyltransferase